MCVLPAAVAAVAPIIMKKVPAAEVPVVIEQAQHFQ
jgi:hypothetical protein